MRKFIIQAVILIALVCPLSSCKKFVRVDPPTNVLLGTAVYSNDGGAIAALSSVYARMATFNTMQYSRAMGYSSDEFNNFSTNSNDIQFFTNGLLTNNAYVKGFWNDAYFYIYQANALLEGLQKSPGVSAKVNTQLQGEAKFIRAFYYYYLVNQFGDVPLVTSTDYATNALMPRTPALDVVKQIIADLKDAEANLSNNYLGGDAITTTTEKLRPTKAAARFLLSRTYLYQKDWANAEAAATAVISTGVYSLVTADLTKVMQKNSIEAIWQVSTNSTFNTNEGYYFVALSTPAYISLSTSLLNAFEPNDKRRTNWVGSINVGSTTYYYPYKYRIQNSTTVSEYVMVLRYAELFLLRAEAYAQQNKLTEAISDLNTIRTRAGLPLLPSSLTQTQLLAAIEQEHRIEMFSEWGDRWLFLKRTSRVDAIMSVYAPTKGTTWNSNWSLYPIPVNEITNDPNMKQNSGY